MYSEVEIIGGKCSITFKRENNEVKITCKAKAKDKDFQLENFYIVEVDELKKVIIDLGLL